MKKVLLFVILFISFIASAQKIGEWTAHTPGMNVISVDIVRDNIYAATPYGIFYYNTNDNSINRLSKVNGLSDMGINIMRYAQSKDVLFVGYSNTNIDIIDNNGNITNIPDIYNKYILGNKTINNVFFNDRYAYVCCSFGIVVIDLERNEVKDTYIIGPNGTYLGVNDLTLCNGIFYAATERGVYYAEADNANLANFAQWHRFTHDLPHNRNSFSHIECFDNYVVANYSDNTYDNDVLYAITDTLSWSYFLENSQSLISELRVCDDRIIITENMQDIRVYDTDKTLIFTLSGITPQSTVYDKTRNCYWSGTRINSLGKLNNDGSYVFVIFNGPSSSKVFSMNTSGKDLWVAPGGYTSTWAPTWNGEGLAHYNGLDWSTISRWNTPGLDSIQDITMAQVDPRDNSTIYLATFSKGLVVYSNGRIKNVYSGYNSSLGFNVPWLQLGSHYTFISGFGFDSSNNMWLANSGADKQLSVWRTDGTWQSYNIGSGDIGRMMVDKNDVKWIFKRGGELTVFYNGTTKTVNRGANSGNLPGEGVNCFATDNNGTVWIGTTDGVALFYDSKKIFRNDSYACSRILIPRNDGTGQADYLLSGQSVLAIAVDGANNIWFGTNNGVIQTSNDGQTTYHHFTMENSPLFSNTVKDIAIDADGNIYFSTDYGIVSYKGTATEGQEKNDNVIVYPNPVRPEHNGIVGIKGLVTNSLVKITTTNGSFVTHLQAQGGQAVWDCTDINGNKVEPGIYLIFTSDETGKETYATKVLIMR